PVLGNVAEETVLDLIPLRRPRREVRDADGEAAAIGEPLQLELPEARACSVAAAAVGGNEQLGGTGVRSLAHGSPPLCDGLDSELRRVVIGPDVDPASVAGQVVDAVWNHLAERGVDEVVDANWYGLPFGLPFSATVLEFAHKLLLLGVYRDH